MNYQLAISNSPKYIECLPGDSLFSSESDALDALSFCIDNQTRFIMLFEENMSDDFYVLITGVAGAILQKFINYGVIVALIISDEQIKQKRFREMVTEANRGSDFRTFGSREDAEAWFKSFEKAQ
jgi:PadR family transcriptional regulator, regulatory protein AphA